MVSAMNLKWQGARTHLLATTLPLLRTMTAVVRMPRLDTPVMGPVCWTATAMAYAIKMRSWAARITWLVITIPRRQMRDTAITQKRTTTVSVHA